MAAERCVESTLLIQACIFVQERYRYLRRYMLLHVCGEARALLKRVSGLDSGHMYQDTAIFTFVGPALPG